MAGLAGLAGIDETRDGIVAAMLGDMFGAQAPGLSNTAQGAQVASAAPSGQGIPGGLAASPQGSPAFGTAPYAETFGPTAPGANVYGNMNNEFGSFSPDSRGTQQETPYGPSYFNNTFEEFSNPPAGPVEQTPGTVPGVNDFAANPAAYASAQPGYGSGLQSGQGPQGQMGQAAPGGVNAPVAGIPDYAITDPFGEFGAFGPDAYGQPGGLPSGQGVNQGPYGEFGGIGPEAYGAYAGAAPEDFSDFGDPGAFGDFGDTFGDSYGDSYGDGEGSDGEGDGGDGDGGDGDGGDD